MLVFVLWYKREIPSLSAMNHDVNRHPWLSTRFLVEQNAKGTKSNIIHLHASDWSVDFVIGFRPLLHYFVAYKSMLDMHDSKFTCVVLNSVRQA